MTGIKEQIAYMRGTQISWAEDAADTMEKLEAVLEAVLYLAWDDRGLLLRGAKELGEAVAAVQGDDDE